MLFSEKRLSKKISFEELPPRVIIYDILSFFEFVIDDNKDKFCLYGYFKRDRFRNLWLSFTSVRFGSYSTSTSLSIVFIRFSKVENITLFDYKGSKKIMEAIVEESENMFRLRKLSLRRKYHRLRNYDISNETVDIFRKQNCFPALEVFYCDVGFGISSSQHANNSKQHIDTSKWSERKNPFSQIRKLHLRGFTGSKCSDFLADFFAFQKSNFQKHLSSISLVRVSVPNDITIELPNLRNIELYRCQNIYLFSKSLVSLDITFMESKYVREIIRVAYNLKKLMLKHVQFKSSDNWFFDQNMNPLTHLTEIELFNLKNFDPSSLLDFETKWKPILHHLESVDVDDCFSPEIIQSLFLPNPKLKKVYLYKCSINLDGLEFEQKLNLKELGLEVISAMAEKTVNVLFRTTGILQNLESMVLMNYDLDFMDVDGKDWVQFNNLAVLILWEYKNFDDIFFRQQHFRKLEELEIRRLRLVTGTKWNENKVPGKFCNLKVLKIGGCRKITDDLFLENDFPKLEVLELMALPLVTGKGWEKKREGILEVRVTFCLLWE